jgi:cytochrome c peroxidase
MKYARTIDKTLKPVRGLKIFSTQQCSRCLHLSDHLSRQILPSFTRPNDEEIEAKLLDKR